MTFADIHTERLVLRAPLPNDAEAAYQRRSLPEVARYQDWEMPYTRERAVEGVTAAAAMDGPADGSWWAATVVDAAQPEHILGDVAVGINWGGRSAEIGYTFHPDYWGRGYAAEAAEAMVRYLFTDFGVSRVEAQMHPDNPASARVAEACGMIFEGRTRQSFWVGDECSDNVLYGATRSDWEAWRDRPTHRPEHVQLVPVTEENARAVSRLVTHKSQERFVTQMLGNFRDALVPPSENSAAVVPWFRAIEADGQIAGFIMASEITDAHPNPYLWRFLVDRMHQGRGIGSKALDLFEQRCWALGAEAIEVSYVEGPGSPERVYRSKGFVPSGKIEDGETHAVKQLIGKSGPVSS